MTNPSDPEKARGFARLIVEKEPHLVPKSLTVNMAAALLEADSLLRRAFSCLSHHGNEKLRGEIEEFVRE